MPKPVGLGTSLLSSIGKYRIVAELGHGGMANVYLAEAKGPSGFCKLVVLKTLLPQFADEPEVRESFLEEARLAGRLNHANVVQTYEIGHEGDRDVIVMEYLEGQSLVNVQRRAKVAQSPLSLAMHLRIIMDALEGIHYAHEMKDYDGTHLQLVHRDISPHNVFVTFDGQTKVLDFGIAKAARSANHTAEGVIKGKISYMAPEQVEGSNIDRRADLFSVGVMLWRAATGEKLWKGLTQVTIMHRLMAGDPTPVQCESQRRS